MNRPIAQLHSQRRLSQRRTTRTITISRVRQQNNKRSHSTRHHRVKVNAQSLHVTLLSRVRNSSGRASVRSSTHTRLISQQATLHTPNHGTHRATGHELLNAKSTLENHQQHLRNLANVQQNNQQTQQQIQHRHNRNQPLSHRRNRANTTENNCRSQRHHNQANSDAETHRVSTRNINAERVRRSIHHSIRLNRHKHKRVSDHNERHEDVTHPRSIQATLHVVRRTTNIGILTALLVQLTQKGLRKSRSRTNSSNNPHPEHSTRAAHSNSQSNTRNSTGTHTRSRRNSKRTERRNALLTVSLTSNRVTQDTDHFLNRTPLHTASTDRNVQTSRNQSVVEEITPHPVLHGIHGGSQSRSLRINVPDDIQKKIHSALQS